MVFFNYATMEMSAKIVYYGPGLCGKTTNLQQIYNVTNANTRGEMVSLATETDRTLFFDLLPINLGTIGGFKTRFQLYTVPGQVFYNSTRKLVLKGVDAVVFVADSQEPMLDANIESLENLQQNLGEMNLSLEDIPWVIQYNKRDLPNILSVAELNRHLNKSGVPSFEAVAVTGKGVLETLKGISKLTLLSLRKKTGEMEEEEEEEEEEAGDDVDFDVDDDEELDDLDDFDDDDDDEYVISDEDEDDEDVELDDDDDDEFEDEDDEEEVVAPRAAAPAAPARPAAAAPAAAPAVAAGVREIVQKVIVPVELKKGESLDNLKISVRFDVQFQVKKQGS